MKFDAPLTYKLMRCVSMKDFILPVVIQHDRFLPHERVDDATGSYESLRFQMAVWFKHPANQPFDSPLHGMFNYSSACRWLEQRSQGMSISETFEELLDQFMDAALEHAQDVDVVRMQASIVRGDLTSGDICCSAVRYWQTTELELMLPDTGMRKEERSRVISAAATADAS